MKTFQELSLDTDRAEIEQVVGPWDDQEYARIQGKYSHMTVLYTAYGPLCELIEREVVRWYLVYSVFISAAEKEGQCIS